MADLIDFPARLAHKYQAFAQPAECRVRMLTLIYRDDLTFLTLPYSLLESVEPPPDGWANNALVLRFGGSVVRDVLLEGSNFVLLLPHLLEETISWVKELPAGMVIRNRAVTVIDRISVQKVER